MIAAEKSVKVEDAYTDILQNIEFAIVSESRADPSVIDLDVLQALKALTRYYTAEERQGRPSELRIGDKAKRVFQAAQAMCEWRLGRRNLPVQADEGSAFDAASDPVDVTVILQCLRRLQKSVRFWNNEGGRKGYLDYASSFMP